MTFEWHWNFEYLFIVVRKVGMSEAKLNYLKLHEALEKINSPHDQPPFQDKG
jgi:hypothetical protein